MNITPRTLILIIILSATAGFLLRVLSENRAPKNSVTVARKRHSVQSTMSSSYESLVESEQSRRAPEDAIIELCTEGKAAVQKACNTGVFEACAEWLRLHKDAPLSDKTAASAPLGSLCDKNDARACGAVISVWGVGKEQSKIPEKKLAHLCRANNPAACLQLSSSSDFYGDFRVMREKLVELCQKNHGEVCSELSDGLGFEHEQRQPAKEKLYSLCRLKDEAACKAARRTSSVQQIYGVTTPEYYKLEEQWKLNCAAGNERDCLPFLREDSSFRADAATQEKLLSSCRGGKTNACTIIFNDFDTESKHFSEAKGVLVSLCAQDNSAACDALSKTPDRHLEKSEIDSLYLRGGTRACTAALQQRATIDALQRKDILARLRGFCNQGDGSACLVRGQEFIKICGN